MGEEKFSANWRAIVMISQQAYCYVSLLHATVKEIRSSSSSSYATEVAKTVSSVRQLEGIQRISRVQAICMSGGVIMWTTDVDECRVASERGQHVCLGVCENTHGSFVCSCPPGYRMSSDQRTCHGTSSRSLNSFSDFHNNFPETPQNILF